jgi:hypothetical protein
MPTLYFIYYDCGLVYIGRTKQRLNARLHGHFFKAAMHRVIDIFGVTRIEYAELPTVADMYLYEVYLINKLKPILNCDDKARDELTVALPELEIKPYHCNLMEKWRSELEKRDTEEKRQKREKTLAYWKQRAGVAT